MVPELDQGHHRPNDTVTIDPIWPIEEYRPLPVFFTLVNRSNKELIYPTNQF
jgi:hypothetical protein